VTKCRRDRKVAISGGMPAAVDSFRITREFFAEMDKA
jgi:hypothetical protein